MSRRWAASVAFSALGCLLYSCEVENEGGGALGASGEGGEALAGAGLPSGRAGEARGGSANRGGHTGPGGGDGAGQGGAPHEGGRGEEAEAGGTGGEESVVGGAGQNAGGGGVSGGEGGNGGEPDPGWPFGNTKLGARCKSDVQCSDPKAPGLICLEPTDTSPGAAPPEGLCTAACETDAECMDIEFGSFCEGILGGAGRFCVEGCFYGETLDGAAKCHARDEFACNPLFFLDTQLPCSDKNDCGPGELCTGETCELLVFACLPACQGDNDCEPNLYCDRAFLTGTCVEEPQVGKGLGEPCTVTDQEPDECLGFCRGDMPGATGYCSQTCSSGYPCAFDEDSQLYQGNCVDPDAETSFGDFGYCEPACNCSKECQDPSLVCVSAEYDPRVFVGQGQCGAGGTPVIDQCGGGGR